jgi:hypothetical protein
MPCRWPGIRLACRLMFIVTGVGQVLLDSIAPGPRRIETHSPPCSGRVPSLSSSLVDDALEARVPPLFSRAHIVWFFPKTKPAPSIDTHHNCFIQIQFGVAPSFELLNGFHSRAREMLQQGIYEDNNYTGRRCPPLYYTGEKGDDRTLGIFRIHTRCRSPIDGFQ